MCVRCWAAGGNIINPDTTIDIFAQAVCAFNVRLSDKNAFKEVAAVDDQLISLSKNNHSYVSARSIESE